MLAELFYKLREFQVPVSVTEYLTLLSAMEKGISGLNIDSFYFLARSALVKDERFFDRFDIVFGLIVHRFWGPKCHTFWCFLEPFRIRVSGEVFTLILALFWLPWVSMFGPFW